MKKNRRIIVPGVSIWPQPKSNPRQRYRISYGPKSNRKHIYASADLQTTVELAREIARTAERLRLGLAKPVTERFATEDRNPISSHLADWKQSLVDARCTAKHVRQFHQCATAVLLGTAGLNAEKDRGRKHPDLDGVGAGRISEIVPSLVQRQVAKVYEQRGAATANRYLNAVGAFLNWGVADLRWERNTCSHLTKYNTETDRKRVRRIVSVAEAVRVIYAADAGGEAEGVSGIERGMIYRTSVASGLRANELRHLTVGDLVPSGTAPGLWTTAKRAKNRRRVFVAIPPELAASLQQWCQDKKSTDRMFTVPENTARMLRHDLSRCDPVIDYKNERGEVFDFHALRHQCGAILIAAGVSPKAVQLHMRHSSIKLTLDTYGHLMEGDTAKVVAALDVVRPAQRRDGPERPRVSADVHSKRNKTLFKGRKMRKTKWSDGESNPDLLNAIQQAYLRKNNRSNDLRLMGKAFGAPGAARRATAKIRAAMAIGHRRMRRARAS